jgi:GTP-binding protein
VKIAAEFVTSAVDTAGFPKERLPELALVGRSNVGKSTLINALVRTKVARTSRAPGKTRLANFYRVAPEGLPPFYLVDLPGYGYARGGEASAREFQAIAGAYFDRGAGPSGVFLLIDSRHPGLESDLHAWRWLESLNAPCSVVATKLDKLSRAEAARHLKELERIHASPVVGVSAQTGEGMKELWEQIATRLRPRRP